MRIEDLFDPYQGKKTKLKDYQDTDDIVRYMLRYHKQYAPQYDKASEQFWDGNAEKTGKKIFDFLKQNVHYDVEPNADQSIKSPGALLTERHGDCKHYASFIMGIVDSLKRKGYPINGKYRFASYSIFRKEPHHVFAVIVDPATGTEYWTDPVMKNYNNRKAYSHSYDKTPSMTLSSISGIGKSGKKTARKAKQQKKHTAKVARRKERKANRPKGGFLKKIGGAPSRNAYLLLNKLNLFHTASKVYEKVKDDPEKQRALKAKWLKLGGNWASYKKALNQGVRVWNKHHKSKQLQGKLSGVYNNFGWDMKYPGVYLEGIGEIPFQCQRIGIVPVIAGAAAVVAAAAPIIAAMKPLFKSLGVKTDDQAEDAAVQEGNEVLEDAATNSNDAPPEEDDSVDEVPVDPMADSYMEENQVTDGGTDLEGDDIDPMQDYGEVSGIGRRTPKKKPAKKPARKPALKAPAKPLPGGTLKPVTVTASRYPNASVKLPLARKTKTVTRAPFIQITTSKLPGVHPAKKQALHIPKVQADPQHQTNDSGGVSNFMEEVKNFVTNNKMPLLLAGGGIVAYKLLLNQPKRRR